MNEWISVKNEFPDGYITVLVSDGLSIFPAFYNKDIKEWLSWSGWEHLNLSIFQPTHWMYLPQKPESVGEQVHNLEVFKKARCYLDDALKKMEGFNK